MEKELTRSEFCCAVDRMNKNELVARYKFWKSEPDGADKCEIIEWALAMKFDYAVGEPNSNRGARTNEH